MPVTILGQNVRMIRPEKIKKHIVPKHSSPKYDTRTKTTVNARVAGVALMLQNGGKRTFLDRRVTHDEVMEMFGVMPKEVFKTGWLLENGSYVWSR